MKKMFKQKEEKKEKHGKMHTKKNQAKLSTNKHWISSKAIWQIKHIIIIVINRISVGCQTIGKKRNYYQNIYSNIYILLLF